MKNLLTITFVLLAFLSYGQDTTYYDSNHKEVKSINQADHYQIIMKSPTNKKQVTTKAYYKSGQQKYERFSYKREECYKEWYENGQLHRADTTNRNGEYNGQVLTYWENGTPKRNDTFENGKLIKGFCYNKSGNEIKHFDYLIMPCFPGGKNCMMQYLNSETKYPYRCEENGIQGTAYVEFVVNKDGLASEIKLKGAIDYYLGTEAIRVASSMPQWSPGLLDGDPIRVKYTMPVKFKLQ